MDRRRFLLTAGGAGTLGILSIGALEIIRNDDGGEPTETEPPRQSEPHTDGGSGNGGEEERGEGEGNGEVESEGENGEEDVSYAEEFGTVIDAVEVGADPEGEETVNFVFEEHADDDTLFVFEAGTYRIDPVGFSDFDHLGLVGADDERPTFVPTPGDCLGGHPYVECDQITDLVIDGVDFDFEGIDAGGPIHLFVHGESTVRNVAVQGSCSNQIAVFRIDVRDPGGTATVSSVDVANSEDHQSLTGLFVGEHHAGELVFEDCTAAGFSDNGLYASDPGVPDGGNGPVHVVGGKFTNNNISNVRLGTTGSTARDLAVTVDSAVHGWGRTDARGIRLRTREDQIVENCDLRVTADATPSSGAIVIHHENDGALIRDTRIEIDHAEVPAIRTLPPANNPSVSPEFEGVEITGTASNGTAVVIDGRDETVFRKCTIKHAGNRDGIVMVDAENCRIVDCRIETGGAPIVLRNATATIEGTTLITPEAEQTITEMSAENTTITPE